MRLERDACVGDGASLVALDVDFGSSAGSGLFAGAISGSRR